MVDFILGSIEVLVDNSTENGASLEIRTVSEEGVLINEFTGIYLKPGAKITVSFGQEDENLYTPEVPDNYQCPLCHENGDLGVAAYDLQTGYIRLYKCLVCKRRWTLDQLFTIDAPPTLQVKASDSINTEDKFGGQ